MAREIGSGRRLQPRHAELIDGKLAVALRDEVGGDRRGGGQVRDRVCASCRHEEKLTRRELTRPPFQTPPIRRRRRRAASRRGVFRRVHVLREGRVVTVREARAEQWRRAAREDGPSFSPVKHEHLQAQNDEQTHRSECRRSPRWRAVATGKARVGIVVIKQQA